jgi:DNA-binding protein Alba|tara:strand:- start:404 stop:691 length:288 start_codon:yes stop_codon:yes gene_type:complete
MIKPTIDYANEKFLITDEPVMKLAMDVIEILNKIDRISIKGKGETCPATVSVANIVTQNLLKHITKTEKIHVDSEISDDGRLISTIEVIITKTSN